MEINKGRFSTSVVGKSCVKVVLFPVTPTLLPPVQSQLITDSVILIILVSFEED